MIATPPPMTLHMSSLVMKLVQARPSAAAAARVGGATCQQACAVKLGDAGGKVQVDPRLPEQIAAATCAHIEGMAERTLACLAFTPSARAARTINATLADAYRAVARESIMNVIDVSN